MTIKLVKRNQQAEATDKQAPQPSTNQIFLNTQGWVEEFRERKAKNIQTMMGALRHD